MNGEKIRMIVSFIIKNQITGCQPTPIARGGCAEERNTSFGSPVGWAMLTLPTDSNSPLKDRHFQVLAQKFFDPLLKNLVSVDKII
jgi:hypothetical protein